MMLLRKIGRIIQIWLTKFWIPLSITVVLLTMAITTTTVLLHREQVTVKISNIPVHTKRGVSAPSAGVLNRGEHLQILKRDNGWYQIRREDESEVWVAGWLVERTQPLDKITPLSEATVVLDPGHGGSDAGAISNGGDYEKKYTLELGQAVRKELEKQGTRVIMTRSTDKLVELANIPTVAEKNQADMFISFHFDSSPQSNSASGFTTYYYHENNGSLDLARDVNKAIAPNMPKDMPNKGEEFGDFLVIRENSVPAILMENGYINSNKDLKHMKSKEFTQQLARDIPDGLQSYLARQKQ
ncbi:N-acetylmuramoyl-L-alanine amidase [Weissella minor]|uniref:N-acetylmuramoyl-L-alanine amidase n=1 Tax=Weissella minor TaxID=1620 RepID=UPI003AF21E96